MNIVSNLALEMTSAHGGQPTEPRLLAFVTILTVVGVSLATYVKCLTVKTMGSFIKEFGVKINRVKRTALEIERKTFHLTGLMVPLLYHILLNKFSWSQMDYAIFCWITTSIIWGADCFRAYMPNGNDFFPFSCLKGLLRDKEKRKLSGTCYFSLGCTLAIALFPPAISTTSILWLVIGDMSAALIGVSFGGDICVVKMGREGKKSAEGSFAMFLSCFVTGLIIYEEIYLAEYAVFLGATAATITELYEPFGLNDNLTIPMISSFALQIGLRRIEAQSKLA